MRILTNLLSAHAWAYRAKVLLHGKNPLSTGEHPDMNLEEGHLGGYIRGRQSSVPTVFGYEHGDPLTWTPDLWRWGYDTLGVRSVLDIGCGEGHSTKFFRDLGCQVLGVDGSAQARLDSVVPESHLTHDFTQGAYRPTQQFDLVWCCEFVEHVEERYLKHILETFTFCSRYLMMTFAGPGQLGYHHVNCKPTRYWIKRVESSGFRFDRKRTKESRAIAPPGHFRARGLFFEKSPE